MVIIGFCAAMLVDSPGNIPKDCQNSHNTVDLDAVLDLVLFLRG